MKRKITKYISYMIMDAILIALSIMLSVAFLSMLEYNYTFVGLRTAIIIIISFKLVMFNVTGIYKMMVDYMDFKSLSRISVVTMVTNGLIVLVMLLDFIPTFIPKTMFLFITPIEAILLVGIRAIAPFKTYLRLRRERQKLLRKKTLIIGAGSAAQMVLKELDHNKEYNNYVIGFLDDDISKTGQILGSKTVLGTINKLDSVIKQHDVDEVIIAIKDYSKAKLNKLYNKINNYENVTVKKVNVFENQSSKVNIVNVNVEDLLNRNEIELDNKGLFDFIKDEVVLVTGGGGSIGSELCRQIFELKPKELIIFDIYENNAYEIQMELERLKFKNDKLETKITALIGSVYNEVRLEEVFSTYRPTIVFHAAAYKHVPLMEVSPREAIRTNVLGTNNTARLADKYKVKKMVLVSSDKAVRSTNVMGATKRYAELIINYYNKKGNTMYSSVRFGNVLGSNGSVIPLFKKQIADGGPLTVTHKEITRYFMTIPEAVGLILQCAVYAKGGEVFILDMGDPVKIYDLAVKMIKLMGLKPFIDIDIEVVGLRPGEKLYEELLVDPKCDDNIQTENSRIFIEKNSDVDYKTLDLEYVKEHYEILDNEGIRGMLAHIIKTYQVNGDKNGNS